MNNFISAIIALPHPYSTDYAKRKYPLKRLFRMILFMIARSIPMSGYTRTKIYRFGGVDIEKGKGRCGVVNFDTLYPQNIHIGKGCEIVNGCTILSHFYDVSEMHSHSHLCGEIYIGQNVYIGTNVVITKPIIIGDGAVIGAGSIVNKNVPSYQVWAGVPAKFIRKRYSEDNPMPQSTDDFECK
jgi:acetyltransferase-like isoleucine patch superfamily enzyme